MITKLSKTVAMLMVLALVATALPVSAQSDRAVEGPITITDSRGVITNLTQPAAHVASFGAFATNTLIDVGELDKAVIFDAGSEFNKSSIPEMAGIPLDKFITVSSANKDAVVQRMLELADLGTWNKTTDVIFGYGYDSYSAMWSELESYGFHVITFYPHSYDGIVQVVEDIESVAGSNHSVSQRMTYVKEFISDELSEAGIDQANEFVKALYVSYSGNELKIGNNGSVTVDFINYAGGVNVGRDANKTSPTYSVDPTAIIQLNPDIVLLDGYYSGTADDFKAQAQITDSGIEVFKLNKSWNSYCPDAMVGLWTIACLFYPNVFEGDIPSQGNADGNGGIDTMMIAIVGIAIVLLATVLILAMRRKEKKDQ